jgi:hypothetical protein
MSCSRGDVAAGDLACRFKAGKCNEKSLLSLVAAAVAFKDNTAKGSRKVDIMTSVQCSLRYGNSAVFHVNWPILCWYSGDTLNLWGTPDAVRGANELNSGKPIPAVGLSGQGP